MTIKNTLKKNYTDICDELLDIYSRNGKEMINMLRGPKKDYDYRTVKSWMVNYKILQGITKWKVR